VSQAPVSTSARATTGGHGEARVPFANLRRALSEPTEVHAFNKNIIQKTVGLHLGRVEYQTPTRKELENELPHLWRTRQKMKLKYLHLTNNTSSRWYDQPTTDVTIQIHH
jgi:hypothetical protein